MTVENCIKLLKKYKDRMENPTGVDLTEKNSVKEQAKTAYENMKKHILKSRKFRGHEILKELGVKEEPKKKEDGKKSKR